MKERNNVALKQKWSVPLTVSALLGLLFFVGSWHKSAFFSPEFTVLFPILGVGALSFLLYYNGYPRLQKLSTTQLGIIFVLSSLHLLFCLNSSLQSFILDHIKRVSTQQFYLPSSWMRQLVYVSGVFGIFGFINSALSYSTRGRFYNPLVLLWNDFIAIELFYSLLYASIRLQKHNAKIIPFLWHQLFSSPFNMQLLEYGSVLSLCVLVIFPMIIWIQASFALFSRNNYFADFVNKLNKYYKG